MAFIFSITHGAEDTRQEKDCVPHCALLLFSVIRKLGTRIMLIMSKK
jgi:hypothetical protein